MTRPHKEGACVCLIMKKFFHFSVIAIPLFLALSFPAFAQLLIEEGKIKKTVAPGQTVADSVTVHNSTDKPVDVIVYLEDFEYVAPFDGSKKFYAAGTLPQSAAQWLNFEPKRFSLAPYTKQKVHFTTNVPATATGGYYSVLFFELADSPTHIDGQVGLQIISRVGSLLFFETTDRKKQVDVTGTFFDGSVLNGTLIHTGNVNLVIKCLYYVLDQSGVPVDRGDLEMFYMPPGTQTDFSIGLNAQLKSGRYTAVLTFDLEDGTSAVKEVDFHVHQGKFQQIDTPGR